MKIDNLKEGDSYKNYPALCKALEMEKKTSNAKKAQLKELSRYCEYQKIGHSFFIKKVYDEPLPKEDNRGKSRGSRGQNSPYNKTIQLLILDMLVNQKLKINETRNNLLLNMNMINHNYKISNEEIPALSELLNIDKSIVYDYFNTTRNNFTNILETALNGLQNQALIDYQKVMSVCEKRDVSNYTETHRVATKEEREMILTLQKRVLEEFGFRGLQEARLSRKWEKFKNKLNELIKLETPFNYIYYSYDIAVNQEYIEKEYTKMLDWYLNQKDRDEYKVLLNETVERRLLETAKRRTKKKTKYRGAAKSRKRFDYIPKYEQLITLTINPSSEDIREEVKKKHFEIKERNKKL